MMEGIGCDPQLELANGRFEIIDLILAHVGRTLQSVQHLNALNELPGCGLLVLTGQSLSAAGSADADRHDCS